MSGRCGASGGSSSSDVKPMRSRKYPVVPKRPAPVCGSWPTSATSPRATSVRTTPSTLTPRTADTWPRLTG
ncbi:Uncharacterised protein [Mycobacteroides abscessus]|nr:Uncharacterised protein [Mycobacteroides abscessus]